MGQILSNSEVEAILLKLDFPITQQAPTSQTEEHVPGDDTVLYDFEHPLPLRQSQIDALRIASAAVSHAFQVRLTSLLHSTVTVNFLGVEQSTLREYLATAAQPACLAIFESSPDLADGQWFLDISRSLAFTMIDCLLGGSPTPQQQLLAITRPFTDVETRLIEKIIQSVLPELAEALSERNSLRMTRLVSDGSLISEAASNEAAVLVNFEVLCGPCVGLMQLCIPWKHVAQTRQRFRIEPDEMRNLVRSGAGQLPVNATACVARLTISARELATLKSGDILLTDTPQSTEISLDVDGREIFRGTPGQIRDRKVIRLTVPVTTGRSDRSVPRMKDR